MIRIIWTGNMVGYSPLSRFLERSEGAGELKPLKLVRQSCGIFFSASLL